MALEKFTISRDDSVYECFPHLCLTRSGRILLVYRESNGHVASDFCRLVLRRSDDAGRTWSDRFVLRDEVCENGVLTKWNCPKIQQLRDGPHPASVRPHRLSARRVERHRRQRPHRALVQRRRRGHLV